MRVLIIYSSKTGNTKKIADALYIGLKDKYDLDISPMDEVSDLRALDSYQALLIGFWVDRGTANDEAKRFIRKIKDKDIGLFATLGANPDSKHGKKVEDNMRKRLLDKSSRLLGVGLYNGLVDKASIDKLKEKPPLFLPRFILNKMVETSERSREPNEEDMENAVATFSSALEAFEGAGL